MRYCLCYETYKDTLIECDKCKIKCELQFEGNWHIVNKYTSREEEGGYFMERCHDLDCKEYICGV